MKMNFIVDFLQNFVKKFTILCFTAPLQLTKFRPMS